MMNICVNLIEKNDYIAHLKWYVSLTIIRFTLYIMAVLTVPCYGLDLIP